MGKIKLNVTGMHCRSCKMLIEDILADLGAKNIEIEVDEKKKLGRISCDFDDQKKIVQAIKNEGYGVS
ncbi:MAG: heavy-metal-associated domain-containing protein [Nanoarchaeota archaeon]